MNIKCRCCSAVVSAPYIHQGDECATCYQGFCPDCAPPNNCSKCGVAISHLDTECTKCVPPPNKCRKCGVEIPLLYTECQEYF